MRRSCLVAAAVLTALVVPALPALAEPSSAPSPTLPTDLTHAATSNVEYLGRFPEHSGTAGGRLSDDGQRFYLTDPRGVYVYDTSTPERPELLGSLRLYQSQTGVALAQEDPDTNGEILLVDAAPTPSATSQLQVVDVSDPGAMRVLSTVPVTDHTWTCVTGTDATGRQNACAFAYGRTGHVVDLRDPENAVLAPTTWRAAVGLGDRSNAPYVHDLTEIRPGWVMSAGAGAVLMSTADPLHPVRVAAIEEEGRFASLGYHSVEWARGGRAPYLVLGTEIAPSPVPGGPGVTENLAGSDCEGDSSVVETWDARSVSRAMDLYDRHGNPNAFKRAGFTRVDAFDAAGRGIFLQGQAPGHVLYCAHWMDLHPAFDQGGAMAVSYYDRGTRFVDVAPDGTMTETGWLVPAEGYSGSPRWISDDVVYVMDYRRGLEVLRLTGEAATGVRTSAPSVLAVVSRDDVFAAAGSSSRGLDVGALLPVGPPLLLLAGVVLVLRRRVGTAALPA